MVAPRKLRTLERGQAKKVALELQKAIKKVAKEQNGKDVVEVKLSLYEVGHGVRPFGNNEPNDYIDFQLGVGDYKTIPLGKYDLQDIANELRKTKGFEIQDEGVFFGFGNFVPDMEFPAWFRKFGKPCEEFKELKKLVKKKYGIALEKDTLYRRTNRNDATFFVAYYPFMCVEYINQIRWMGKAKSTCKVDTWNMGHERVLTIKAG